MSPEKRLVEHDPVGHRITGFSVLGEERDAKDKWVGADLEIRVEGLGSYLLRIVTKDQHKTETLQEAFGDLERPESLLDHDATEVRESFVVNDWQITPDVLITKFGNRIVADDLAESMFYLPPVDRAN